MPTYGYRVKGSRRVQRVYEVYRLLGGDAVPVEPKAFEAVVKQAYEESSAPMKAFLDLLAAHPDEWLSIGWVREALGIKTHQLPVVPSASPSRWRGRYKQAGPYALRGRREGERAALSDGE